MYTQNNRVSDSDPHWISIFEDPGSGSAFHMRIRIHDLKFSWKFWKERNKKNLFLLFQRENTNFLKTLSIFFIFVRCFNKMRATFQILSHPKKFRPWIRIRIRFQTLDPDPQEIDADPKPCLEQAIWLNAYRTWARLSHQINCLELLHILSWTSNKGHQIQRKASSTNGNGKKL